MNSSSLMRWSGIANIVAGALTALFWFIHPDPSLSDASTRLTFNWELNYSIFLIILILMLFGVVGLYIEHMNRYPKTILTAFLLSFIGTALFIGAGTVDGFVTSVLAGMPETLFLLDMQGPLFANLAPVFMLGGAAFAIGFIMFGAAIARSAIYPRIAGIALIISAPILGLSPLMPAALRTAGSVAFGLALIGIGLSVWKKFSSRVNA